MNDLTLVSNEVMAPHLHALVFDRQLDGFDHPGQFITAHPVGFERPGYFAIASTFDEPLTLLVKSGGEVADALISMGPGDTLPVSDPIGNGFPMDRVAGLPLVLLVTGSALSAVRALITLEIAAGLPRPVHLFFGVFTEDHIPFPEDLMKWRESGIDVRIICSEPTSDWDGETGFVQHAADRAGLIRSDVGVVLCGQPQLVEDAKARYAEAGCPDEQLLTNF